MGETPEKSTTAIVTSTSLTGDAVEILLTTALEKARSLGVFVNVAVVDAGGLLLGFVRMPGAQIGAIDIAQDKAWSAVAFGPVPTHAWADMAATLPDAVRDSILNRPRFTVLPGGVPIVVGDALVGAIGVAGAAGEQDLACVETALAAIGASLAAPSYGNSGVGAD